jgi:hypothetical protein
LTAVGSAPAGFPSRPRAARLGATAWAALFALSLAARLAAIARVGFSRLEFGDARAYLFAARTLASTGTYPDNTDLFFFRPPGYPVFLVAATLGDPSRIAAAKIANAVLGAVAVLLLVALSLRIFRSRTVALATGAIAALNPSFLLICDDIQSEPLFLVCLLGSAYLLLAAVDRPSSNLAVAAGVALGLAALTRSTAVAFCLLLLSPLADRRYPTRVRGHLAAAALLGFVVALVPWTLRNYVRFHEWIPISDAGGLSLYHGNSVWTRRFYRLRTRQEYDEWIAGLDQFTRRRLAELEVHGRLSPGQRSRAFARMAIEESRADPSGTMRTFVEKAWQWVRPYPTPWFWPLSIVVAVGIYYSALYALAAAGLASSPRPGVAVFAAAAVVLSMAIHVLFLVLWRYRIPYWDPVLLLYAPAGAASLRRATRGREAA